MKLISYTASNGKEYKVGSNVYLGTGTKDSRYMVGSKEYLITETKDSQNFKYIYAFSPYHHASVFYSSLPAKFEGHIMEVKIIRQRGSKRNGYRFI